MECKLHIPIEPILGGGITHFSYIDVEVDIEKAREVYSNVRNAFKEKEGLDTREWAQARNNMLKTNEFDPNLELSRAQMYWVNQTKLGLRDIKNEK